MKAVESKKPSFNMARPEEMTEQNAKKDINFELNVFTDELYSSLRITRNSKT